MTDLAEARSGHRSGIHTPTARWARLVVSVALADADVAMLDDWAVLVRMSRRTLSARCRAAGAKPKDSMDLGRLLRAVRVGDPLAWRPEDVLDVSDERTMRRLLARGGVLAHVHRRRPEIDVILEKHAFAVPASGLVIVKALLDTSLSSATAPSWTRGM